MLVGVIMLLLSACSSSTKSSLATQEAQMQENVQPDGLQRMQVSEVTTKVSFRGKVYHSTVVRKPDESLPKVINEQGEKFVDNRIILTLTCDGKTVLHRTFTKESFASLVDAKFMKHALLEGVVLDEPSAQGIVYAASVGYPQSDLYVPLRLTVTPDGNLTISKDDLMDDWHKEDL
ncbi:hypothetical protein, secreted [gut metagenome]|uniref:Lipoprotein n=1 Tax=gut metagenome TaxID=749906 RepID=J9FVH0_9ZZZZ